MHLVPFTDAEPSVTGSIQSTLLEQIFNVQIVHDFKVHTHSLSYKNVKCLPVLHYNKLLFCQIQIVIKGKVSPNFIPKKKKKNQRERERQRFGKDWKDEREQS